MASFARSMTVLIPLLASASAWAKAAPLALPPEAVQFRYVSSDGDFQLDCKHYESAAPHGFRVVCGAGTVHQREYAVHLIVRGFRRAQVPRVSYEILYWITDRNVPIQRAFSSGTSWIRFNDASDAHSMTLTQSVENDYASLWVDIAPR